MSQMSTKILDHIIHLVPPGTIDEAIKQFENLGFTVIPGGAHADGLTVNALIVFQDGVYIEIISFIHPASHYPDPTKRNAHRWAQAAPGWIDYAHLGPSESNVDIADIINKRSKDDGTGVFYHPATPGGRERPDGKILKWVINTPEKQLGVGVLPFFCGDVTPRDWRVPVDPPSNTSHSCGAVGIAHVRVLATVNEFSSLSARITSVIGSPPVSSHPEGPSNTSDISPAIWKITTPFSTSSPTDNVRVVELILDLPKDDIERQAIEKNGTGIYEVGIYAKDHRKGPIQTPYGKILWIPDV